MQKLNDDQKREAALMLEISEELRRTFISFRYQPQVHIKNRKWPYKGAKYRYPTKIISKP